MKFSIVQYDRKGDIDGSPDLWALLEEEDDHSILDMGMFAIHSVLHNVTSGVFVRKEKYEGSLPDSSMHHHSAKGDEFSLLKASFEPSGNIGIRRRLHATSTNYRKGSKEATDDEMSLLLDFDDIAHASR